MNEAAKQISTHRCTISCTRYFPIPRLLAGCALVLPAMVGCGSTAVTCAGQCGPPYELQVDFKPGTTHAAARNLLVSCTDRDPVVIRVGAPRDVGKGFSRAMIYTQVIGNTPQTAGLLTCLHHSRLVAQAAWPD